MTQSKFTSCLTRNQLFDDLTVGQSPLQSIKNQLLPDHLLRRFPGLEVVESLRFSDSWDSGPIDTFIGLQVRNCCHILCEVEFDPNLDQFYLQLNNLRIDFEQN